jgi:hypothetical protein
LDKKPQSQFKLSAFLKTHLYKLQWVANDEIARKTTFWPKLTASANYVVIPKTRVENQETRAI